MCLCVCLWVCLFLRMRWCLYTHLHACLAYLAHMEEEQLNHRLTYVSLYLFPTMIANDAQRITLEATNVPLSKLTRSATHVSNNQATFQPLDSGDLSTLLSRSLSACSLLLFSTACSSERSEQLTETLYHKTL